MGAKQLWDVDGGMDGWMDGPGKSIGTQIEDWSIVKDIFCLPLRKGDKKSDFGMQIDAEKYIHPIGESNPHHYFIFQVVDKEEYSLSILIDTKTATVLLLSCVLTLISYEQNS